MFRPVMRWIAVAAVGALAVTAVLVAPALLLPTPTIEPTTLLIVTPTPVVTLSTIAFESEGDIFVLRAAGTKPTRLFQTPYRDTAPAWSPDGTRLAFISDRSGQPEVYVQDLASNEATRLTFDPNVADYLPPIVWSPDSAQLAVTAQWKTVASRQPTQIYLIPLAGGAEPGALPWNTDSDDELPRYGERAPAWSPDGRRLAFITIVFGTQHIAITNFDTPLSRTRTENYWMDETAFAWSPDGKQIAFIALGPGEGGVFEAQLNLAAPEGGEPHTILTQTVSGAPVYQHLLWSPDGTRLLFTAADANGVEQMYLLYTDGSSLTHIAQGTAPQFSPDGHWVVYEHDGTLYALNLDDAFRTPKTLTPVRLVNGTLAHWKPSPSGQIVVAVTDTPSAISALQLLGVHYVQEGESARCIAAAYGISLTALIETNHLGSPPQLPHTSLLIPAIPDVEQIMGHVCAPQFPAPDMIDPPIIVPPPDPPPFALQGDVAAQASPLGCEWLGVTGQTFSRNGTPLAGLIIHVEGGDVNVDIDSAMGRFVAQLAQQPLTTVGVFQVQLRNTNNQPLSDWVAVDTFDDCTKNLLIVNFSMR